MAIVIKILGTPTGQETPFDNKFIVHCNFEAGFGTLAVDVTENPEEAMQFAEAAEAFAYWKTQSKSQPFRPDGHPNRPLTGVNISLETIE